MSILRALALVIPLLHAAAPPADLPHRPRRLSSGTVRVIRQIQLDTFVAAFNERVKSKGDFDKYFLSRLNARDRREARAELSGVDVVPVISREGDTLIFASGEVRVPLEFVDYETGQVRVGGVPWTYDRTAAAGWQLRQLARAFARQLEPEQARLEISLLPRAEAAGLDTASKAMASAMVKQAAKTSTGKVVAKFLGKWIGIGVIWSSAVNGLFSSGICFVTNRAANIDPGLVWGAACNPFNDRNEKQKSADFKGQVGYTDELAKSLSLVRSGGKFDCSEFDPQKPDENYTVSGYIAEVEVRAPGSSTSAAAEARNWKLFRGKLVKGVLKDADVFNADGGNERLLAHITFNENPDNPINVKLPQMDNTGKTNEPLEVPSNYKTDLMLLENASAARRMIYLAKTAQIWVKACLTGQTEAKYLRVNGNSPGAVGAGK